MKDKVKKPKIFISYSHKDKGWKDYIKSFFTSTKKFDIWDDGEILLGEQWHKKIQNALNKADIGMFLISTNFLNSSYIANNEMKTFMDRSSSEKLTIILVYIQPIAFQLVDWISTEDGSLQGFPSPEKPLSSFGDYKNNSHELAEKVAELVTLIHYVYDDKKNKSYGDGKTLDVSENKENYICPYHSPENFYNVMHKFTKNTIEKLRNEYKDITDEKFDSKILIETIGGGEIILPSILLFKGDINFYQKIDETPDNNKIDKLLIQKLKNRCNKKIIDNPTFRLSKILPNNTLLIGESSYSKSLSTCDKHFYNLIDSANAQMRNEVGKSYDEWYDELKKIVIDNDFSSISGSLACSTLVVFKDFSENKYIYAIMDNSFKKNGNNSRHVIPSFMFQPPRNDTLIDDTFATTLDIEFQMFKEFAEEILGHTEYEELGNYNLLKQAMEENDLLQQLKDLLRTNQAEFKVLGLSLDIFRLRPEIITVLIVENQEFYKNINNNIIRQAKNSSNECGFSCFEVDDIGWYNIENQRRYLRLLNDIEKPLVPPGSACLKLGREYVLKNYINRK